MLANRGVRSAMQFNLNGIALLPGRACGSRDGLPASVRRSCGCSRSGPSTAGDARIGQVDVFADEPVFAFAARVDEPPACAVAQSNRRKTRSPRLELGLRPASIGSPRRREWSGRPRRSIGSTTVLRCRCSDTGRLRFPRRSHCRPRSTLERHDSRKGRDFITLGIGTSMTPNGFLNAVKRDLDPVSARSFIEAISSSRSRQPRCTSRAASLNWQLRPVPSTRFPGDRPTGASIFGRPGVSRSLRGIATV